MFGVIVLISFVHLSSETVSYQAFQSQKEDASPSNLEATLDINLESAFYRVDEKFLCVTIDSNAMRGHWQSINLTSTLLITLAKGLSPVTLRVGGTSQDFAYFAPDSHGSNNQWHMKDPKDKVKILENTTEVIYKKRFNRKDVFMDGNFTWFTEDWDLLHEFVQNAGWDLVFGLNSYITKNWRTGVWDSSNAEELVKYTMDKKYSVWAWELGNEPDLNPSPYDDIITPNPLAKDFHQLHKMLHRVGWPNILLAGPDTATLYSGNEFLSNFLNKTKENVLHAVTYHQYYMSSVSAKEKDFTDVLVLDGFSKESVDAATMARKLQPEAQLWLGETSSTYDGGAAGLSDAYIAGFLWLDKLGLAALSNHSKVFRQTFYGGYYSLTYDDETPTPDYWLSLLYVRLVGSNVLQVVNGMEHGRMVRMYAHCVKPSAGYSSGAVVVFVLNLHTFESWIHLRDVELAYSIRDVYWLEPGDSAGLLSKKVALNGEVLSMKSPTTLPDLIPVEAPPSSTIYIPSQSFGFIVFKDVQALACLQN